MNFKNNFVAVIILSLSCSSSLLIAKENDPINEKISSHKLIKPTRKSQKASLEEKLKPKDNNYIQPKTNDLEKPSIPSYLSRSVQSNPFSKPKSSEKNQREATYSRNHKHDSPHAYSEYIRR